MSRTETGARLLVLEGNTSAWVELPADGVADIGRSPSAFVKTSDPKVARRHATLSIAHGTATLENVDSQQSTRLNDERIDRPRVLANGDVIDIGDLSLVFYGARRSPAHRLLDGREIRDRLAEEIARAAELERTVAIALITFGAAVIAESAVSRALAVMMRPIDIAGWASPSELVVLFPELSPESATHETARLIAALGPEGAATRVGLAACPRDGCDADGLIAVARAAAAVSGSAGRVADASELETRIQAGDQSLVAVDPAMVLLFALVQRLAGADLPVLIRGERGTGKMTTARALHAWSLRAAKRFVRLDCAALPASLANLEGLLRAASGGSLFLDELAGIPLAIQSELVGLLEAGRMLRTEDAAEIDVRIIAASDRDLEAEVRAGRLRQDLFFRLSEATVTLVPLRRRVREIPLLARAFLEAAAARAGRTPPELSGPLMQILTDHAWPGNVRELENAIGYALAAASPEAAAIEPWHLPDPVIGGSQAEAEVMISHPGLETSLPGKTKPRSEPRKFVPLAEEIRALEKRRMIEALEAAGGVQKYAADLISMPYRTFVFKVREYGLTNPKHRREE